jgi:hypothetical protein
LQVLLTEYQRNLQYFGETHIMDAFCGAGFHKDQLARITKVVHSMGTASEKLDILNEYYDSAVKQHIALTESGALRSESALCACRCHVC